MKSQNLRTTFSTVLEFRMMRVCPYFTETREVHIRKHVVQIQFILCFFASQFTLGKQGVVKCQFCTVLHLYYGPSRYPPGLGVYIVLIGGPPMEGQWANKHL